jgi:hypothetical protein
MRHERAVRLVVLALGMAAVSACNCGGETGCDGGVDAGCGGGGGGGQGGGGGTGGGGGGPAPLSGTFDLSWTQGARTWTLEGRGFTLPVHDTGIDETNYDATGTVTISPTSYTEGAMTCTLVGSASRAFSESYFFKVRYLTGGPAQRWGYLDQWDYTCTSSGGSQVIPVIVNFRTAQGTACSTPTDVPAASAPTMSGSFTMDCLPPYVGVATWSFSP